MFRKKWTDQVRRTRKNTKPTEHSVFCSKKFEHWRFEHNSRLSEAIYRLSEVMGLRETKPHLRAGAVPTQFQKPASLKEKIPAVYVQSKKGLPAYEKLGRSSVN